MKKTVRIKLFKDNGRYNAPVFVGLNEYTALIPRGIEVSVPYAVARMLEESQAQDAATALMMTRMAGEFEERAAAME